MLDNDRRWWASNVNKVSKGFLKASWSLRLKEIKRKNDSRNPDEIVDNENILPVWDKDNPVVIKIPSNDGMGEKLFKVFENY